MFRAFTLVAAAAATAAGGAGCVTCHHEAHKAALAAGPRCEMAAAERQKVYVYLVNGLTPTGTCGLSGLRDKLGEHGFSKVGYGQLVHWWWVADEMRTVHADNPDARFVLIGYDLGGGVAVRLARDARQAGIPVEAVVLLDPTGTPAHDSAGVRTLLVTSGAGGSPVPHTESVAVPDANHFTLPSHPKTVAVVSHLLNGIAAKLWRPVVEAELPWTYEHAPMFQLGPVHSGESDVLGDRPGGVTLPLGSTEVQEQPRRVTPPGLTVSRKPGT